jgi:TolB protein|tara:strand:- start:90 stop:1004 length:915 start_codon:yes stop_codon:yes gene_type:complete
MNLMRKPLYLLFLVTFLSCNQKNKKQAEKYSPYQEIAFVSDRDGNSEIYMMDVNGDSLKRLTNNESLDFSPDWGKDGASVYFYSKRDGNEEIYSVNTKSTEVTRITDHPAKDVLPTPSPDGKLIVFMSDRDSLSRNVYVMDKDGSNIRSLTKNKMYEESPSWSPNGKNILFTRQLRDSTDNTHAANGEIHIMNADGSNVRRLTNKKGYDSGAKFSPDGKKIAFYGLNDRQWDLYIMDADGSNLVNLTNDSIECYSPDWSPDGEWLVYTAGSKGNYNIWKINILTKERIQLTDTEGRNEGPVWRN